MFTRSHIAAGLALAGLLITSVTAFAKGGFSFITIAGSNLKEEIRSTDIALTEDFFAFADFYRNKTSAPADPGTGYEITRYYLEGVGEIPFDRLHYYPETGFVYYDGIVNGSSEYDKKWYTAKPEIKSLFEQALSIQSMDNTQSSTSAVSKPQTQSRVSLPPFPLIALALLGITGVLLFTHRLRKSFSH